MKIKNFAKVILTSLLAIAIVIPSLSNCYAAQDGIGYFNYSNNTDGTENHEPKLEVSKNTNLGTIKAGKDEVLSLSLKNISHDSAHYVKLELKPDPKDEKIFIKREFRQEVKTIKPTKEKSFEFPLTLNSATPEGTYNLVLVATYKNAYHDVFTKEYPLYFYVENSKVQPLIEISGIDFENGWINSDEASKMRINLINKGGLVAKNIELKLEGLDPKTVSLDGDTSFRKLSALHPGVSQLFGYKLKANPNADSEAELNAILTYYDEVDNKYETTHKILVPCSASAGLSKMSIVDMTFSKEEYALYGDDVSKVKLSLKNNSDKDLKNLKLELSSDGSVVFMSNYINLIENLKAGETKDFSYSVASSNPDNEGNHPITAKLGSASASSDDDSKIKIQIAGVTCYKKGGAGEGKKPKIIISDYSYSGKKIVAGKEFELRVQMKNTSQSIGVKNVKVTHSSQDDVFIPIDAANSFFIDYIPPNSVVERKFKLTSKPDAAAKMYKMDFKGEYEDESGKSYDEKGNPFVSEESIVLNLTQEIRLEIPDLKIQEFAMVGEGIPIETEFYNMGKAPLYNMMVKLEGDFDTDVSNYFVGNFEASRSDMFSAKITPIQAGELKGKLIFEFEDESGNKDSIIKDFTINVDEGAAEMGGMGNGENFDEFNSDEMGDMADMEFDENGNPIEKSSWLSFASLIRIVITLIIVVIVVIVVLKKRKKKKLEKFLLESDDETE